VGINKTKHTKMKCTLIIWREKDLQAKELDLKFCSMTN